jgi:enamine deaminase RidA (YjgF/YER057c/UK114 family)
MFKILLPLSVLLNMSCKKEPHMIESEEAYQTYSLGFSQAVKAGGLIFLSGQVGWDKSFKLTGSSFQDQLDQSFLNVGQILEEAHSTFDQVVLIRFYVKDLDTQKRSWINQALSGKYQSHYKPATTLIGVETLAREDLLIEIEVIAKK